MHDGSLEIERRDGMIVEAEESSVPTKVPFVGD